MFSFHAIQTFVCFRAVYSVNLKRRLQLCDAVASQLILSRSAIQTCIWCVFCKLTFIYTFFVLSIVMLSLLSDTASLAHSFKDPLNVDHQCFGYIY